MGDNELSAKDKEFLAKCEENLKDRFTENDEEFMKVFNREQSTPPIVENWRSFNSGRRYDNRNRGKPYDRYGNRERHRGNYNHRRYNDHNNTHERNHSSYSNY